MAIRPAVVEIKFLVRMTNQLTLPLVCLNYTSAPNQNPSGKLCLHPAIVVSLPG